jgi:hypothetical protein
MLSDLRTHEISDVDGDGRAERVEIQNPQSFEISVTLRLSRGLDCTDLAEPFAHLPVADIVGSTVLAEPGSRALWIAYGTNAGTEVALAHRDGCMLRYLSSPPGVVFHASTSIYGHVCCAGASASVRCVAHTGWVELVTFVALATQGAMATGSDIDALPFTWGRDQLRLEQKGLVTIRHEGGHTRRRDALPRRWLDGGGLDCLGVRNY